MMRLHNGDCLNILKMMIEDEVFVDSIVTDPPYELGFMGRSWDSTGIAFQKETWELCFKVLKPGGHLLAFSGSRTYHRMAVAIEDAGFEIRDQVMWLYGSGFPKSMNVGKIVDKKLRGVGVGKSDPKSPLHGTKRQKIDGSNAKHDMSPLYKTQNVEYEYEHDISKQWDGWGTALKPAHEPLVLARKPLSEKSIADNVLKWGTGGINIDECRVEGNDAKYPDTNPDFRDVAKKAIAQGGQDKLNFNQITGAERKKVVRKTRDENGVWTDNNSGETLTFDPHVFKYWDETAEPNASSSSSDFFNLRYSDLLLMKAEAINELSGPTTEAYELIDQVRKRAGLEALAFSLNKEALRDALLLERAKEFVFEGHRWFDLVRTGKLEEKVLLAKPDVTVDMGRHVLFPIPQREINVNPNLVQNPGY